MNFILDPSLVLYLPLYQLEGASFMSKDAHGHLCSVTGALWRPYGRYFDGIDDKVNCGSSDIFDFTTEFALAVWVKLGAVATNKFIISDRDPPNKGGWSLFHYSDDKFYLQGGDGATWGSLSVATVNTYTNTDIFYFVAASFDGTGRLFVNEVEEGTDTSNPLIATNKQTLVGNDQFSPTPFKGVIGEVFAYNREITPQEFQHIRRATEWRYR